MKKGDVVTIRDNSYSKYVSEGELKEVNSDLIRGPQFIIIETGCEFPKSHSFQHKFNDTVIQAIDSGGVVVFIEKRFLQPATHKITIDGKTIKISDESYAALKRTLEG